MRKNKRLSHKKQNVQFKAKNSNDSLIANEFNHNEVGFKTDGVSHSGLDMFAVPIDQKHNDFLEQSSHESNNNLLVDTKEAYGLIGSIDGCSEEGVYGWVIDKQGLGGWHIYKPTASEIEVFIDNESVGIVTANLFRQDLADSLIGDGFCAFNLPIPARFLDGQEHLAVIKDIHTEKVLESKAFCLLSILYPISEANTFTEEKDQVRDIDTNESSIVGSIDGCNGEGIYGWAIDKCGLGGWQEAKLTEPEIDILIDHESIGTVIANFFRQDLADSRIGDGHCAFYLKMPVRYFDGREHSVEIKELSHPNVIESKKFCLTETERPYVENEFFLQKKSDIQSDILEEFIGNIDSCDENGIKGWMLDKRGLGGWQTGKPNAPIQLEVFIDNEFFAQTTANLYREDLATSKIGDGFCSFCVPIDKRFFDGLSHNVEIRIKNITDHQPESFFSTFSINKKDMSFDAQFYLSFYNDLNGLTDEDALTHWSTFGELEGRFGTVESFLSSHGVDVRGLPGEFDAEAYCYLNPDLKLSNNYFAILHYLLWGQKEGRNFKYPYIKDEELTDFDYQFYINYYSDLSEISYENALSHWNSFGKKEGRIATEDDFYKQFNVNLPKDFNYLNYLRFNPDLIFSFSTKYKAIEHYLRYGRSEGRKFLSTSNDEAFKISLSSNDNRRNLFPWTMVASKVGSTLKQKLSGQIPQYKSLIESGSPSIDHFIDNVVFYTKDIIEQCRLKRDSSVLELGSSCGRIALGLFHYLSDKSYYLGVDISESMIDQCQQLLSRRRNNFNFFQLQAAHHYYYEDLSPQLPNNFNLDHLLDKRFDCVIAISFFNHLLVEDAQQFLSCIGQILKKTRGVAYLTFFIIDNDFFSFQEKTGFHQGLSSSVEGVWYGYKGRDFFVGYDITFLGNMFYDAGLTITASSPGSWAEKNNSRIYPDWFLVSAIGE